MKRRKSSFGSLSSFDIDRINGILDREGETGTLRGLYYAFTSSLKSKKHLGCEDLRDLTRRTAKEGAREEVLRKIVSTTRPELIHCLEGS